MEAYILLGGPGAGKGTLSATLQAVRQIPHISTGDLLREETAAATPLGLQAKKHMEAGELVPDHVVNGMVESRLNRPDAEKGFILDGYPRTLEQGAFLDAYLQHSGKALKAVILVEVPDDLVVERLAARRVCPNCGASYHLQNKLPQKEGICDVCGHALIHRADDAPATIRERLRTYRESTFPLVQFYEKKGLLHRFDNSGKVAEMDIAFRQLLEQL